MVSLVVLAMPMAAWAQNLLPNPSFEQAEGNRPAGWRTYTWAGKATFEYATGGRTGDRCLVISSQEGADAAWYCQVPVEPYARYRLRGWIKTENLERKNGRGALLNLHDMQPLATRAVTGTRDWTMVELEFDTEDQDSVWINCLFGGWGLAVGKAYFDDLELQLLERHSPEATRIEVDARARLEPIPVYIYGQFIEHLGRCIYGGIWAEIIEDRKFFYPVGHKESPWKPIGGGQVQMVKEDPFVGEHTPRIEAGSGIRQEGLGLIAGKGYTGRIWLRAVQRPAEVQVRILWGDGPQDRAVINLPELDDLYRKYPLQFTAGVTTESAVLEIEVLRGSCLVGTLSLMPEDNVQGMRRDTLELLAELNAPIYRWPGGNFVSGYDWRKAIGDPDKRPPMKNPAWQGIEHHDFGIDEFITFCRVLGTEPLVVVNSGLGDLQMALEELEYCNGAADTPMGALRARNGHPEPYNVIYWGIGNEMYGTWQLGHMPLADYIKKHNAFAEAMRKMDPRIKLIAVGEVGRWSEGMLQHCADHMDLISEHFYVRERPGLLGHVRQPRDRVAQIAQAHREYRKRFVSLQGKDIRIALDEWNYWYGPYVYGELGTQYFLKDALGVAAALNEFARNTDMYAMACYAQTVNVIGAIKTSKTAAVLDTTGVVLALYRREFGTVPLKTEFSGPIDAQAAWDPESNVLTLAVVNATLRALEIPVEWSAVELGGPVKVFEISNDNPRACNRPGQPMEVFVVEKQLDRLGARLELPPCSVTLYRIPAKLAD
jgi:alpha-N-arabinofuranosidase